MDANQARDRIDELWRNLSLDDYRFQDLTPTAYSWLGDLTAPTTTAASFTANTIGDNVGQYTANTYDNNIGRLGALTNASASVVGNFDPYETQGYDGFVGDLARIDTSQSNQSRDQQIQNLDNWSDLAAKGLAENERASVQQVQDAAQVARARADASIRNDMANRGILGSGSELAQRLAAAQGSANLAADQGNALNDLILQRQNQALGAADALATNIRSQDQSLAAQQAQLFDQFQQRRENIVNQARQYSADAANRSRETAFNANAQGAMQNATMQTSMNLENARRQDSRDQYNSSLLVDNNRYNTNALNDAARYNSDSAYRNASFNANAQNNAATVNAQLLQNQRQYDATNKLGVDQYNIGQRQQMANDNVTMGNRAAETNLDRYNSVQGLRNQQKYNSVSGYSNALNGVASAMDNAEAARQANSNNATKGWIDAGLGAVNAVGKIGSIAGWW